MAESKKYDISVTVHSHYIPEQSDEQAARYVFAYEVTIINTGTVTAQLLSRHWIITDADNQVQEVRGMGVVGEQPTLRPGQAFQYVSGTSLTSPVGTMEGSYQFMAEDGQAFEAPIPSFVLAIPRVLH
ncbi:Co2+/Mg2+ efflux protein ApaG [Chitinimonas lacunae]|uniref:Protein ApaG n=1 Tax=Chitinimonas lacunae TaxID=1963018 RepID=A0ABV8MJV0_9NEIS